MTAKKKDKTQKTSFGVGFIGKGGFKSRLNSKDTKAYQTWRNMLRRCYSDKNKRDNSYKDCYVSDEWHNFQNFALWFYQNHPDDGDVYHLDKDMLVKGNKVYSKETCIFLTPQMNSRISNQKKYRVFDPNGMIQIIVNMKDFCAKNNLCNGAMSAIANGHRKTHKGWRCEHFNDLEIIGNAHEVEK